MSDDEKLNTSDENEEPEEEGEDEEVEDEEGEDEEGEDEEGEDEEGEDEEGESKENEKKPELVQTNEVKIDIMPFQVNEPVETKPTALSMLKDVNNELNNMYNDLKSTFTNFGKEKVFDYDIKYEFGK